MSEEEPLTELELQILLGLERLGGSYQQRNLWKFIGMDSKSGLPALSKLERRGLIVRERQGGEKRGVYIVKLTNRAYELLQKMREVEDREKAIAPPTTTSPMLRLLLAIPCTYCMHISECGYAKIDPARCTMFSRWLYTYNE